jgi:hypothetical protein
VSLHLEFDVLGTPASKGSSRAMPTAGGAVLVPGGSDVNKAQIQAWDGAIREAVNARLRALPPKAGPVFAAGAIGVAMIFRFVRPRSHFRTGSRHEELRADAPIFHAKKPDADKVARSTLDPMSGSVFHDDAQVSIPLVQKCFARPGRVGAWILVMPLETVDDARMLLSKFTERLANHGEPPPVRRAMVVNEAGDLVPAKPLVITTAPLSRVDGIITLNVVGADKLAGRAVEVDTTGKSDHEITRELVEAMQRQRRSPPPWSAAGRMIESPLAADEDFNE